MDNFFDELFADPSPPQPHPVANIDIGLAEPLTTDREAVIDNFNLDFLGDQAVAPQTETSSVVENAIASSCLLEPPTKKMGVAKRKRDRASEYAKIQLNRARVRMEKAAQLYGPNDPIGNMPNPDLQALCLTQRDRIKTSDSLLNTAESTVANSIIILSNVLHDIREIIKQTK